MRRLALPLIVLAGIVGWIARPKPAPDPWEPGMADWMMNILERSYVYFGGDAEDLR